MFVSGQLTMNQAFKGPSGWTEKRNLPSNRWSITG